MATTWPLALFLFFFLAAVTSAQFDNSWQQVNPVNKADLGQVAYGNGVYVVLSRSNYVLVNNNSDSSPNNWKRVTVNLIRQPNYGCIYALKIAYAAAGFLVSCDSNRLVVGSKDGFDWEPARKYLIAVDLIGGNDLYGAVLSNFSLSKNGIDWTPAATQPATTATFTNGRFIQYTQDGFLWASLRGTAWNPLGRISSPPNVSRVFSIAGHDRTLIAFVHTDLLGTITRSDDFGKTWKTIQIGINTRYDLVYANGIFFATTGSSNFRSTDDGLTWSQDRNLNGTTQSANNRFFNTGLNGLLQTSQDGKSWRMISQGYDSTIGQLLASPIGQPPAFIIISQQGQVYVSGISDIYCWEQITSGSQKAPMNVRWVESLNKWVGWSDVAILRASDDLKTWSNLGTPLFNSSLNNSVTSDFLFATCPSNPGGVWLRLVQMQMGEYPDGFEAYVSNDTLAGSWRISLIQDAYGDKLVGMAAGNGIIILASSTGGVSISNDCGRNWTVGPELPGEGSLFFVGPQNGSGVFYCKGKSLVSYTNASTDGITWQTTNLPPSVHAIQYVSSGLFIAEGTYGEVFTSRDGIRYGRMGQTPGRSDVVVEHGGVYLAASYDTNYMWTMSLEQLEKQHHSPLVIID